MMHTASFFQLLPPLPLPAEMSQWDAASVALGLPEMLLMENAARAAFEAVQSHAGPLKGKKILLYMGSGNNGGDAACLARHLLDAEARPLVVHCKALTGYKGVTGRHLRLARAAGVPFCPVNHRHTLAFEPDIIVDGLLGTGFSGPLRPAMARLVEEINQRRPAVFVLALDIPSGLDGRTGRPAPVAVRADVTVSFAAAKPGLVLPEAKDWTGVLDVRPIGIPAVVRAHSPCSGYLLDGRCLAPLAAQSANCYKNSFGHVLVLGGAKGMGGAAHLAARAALRSGAGLVTAASPNTDLSELKNGWAEIMTLGLASDGLWPARIPEPCLNVLSRSEALVVGPGMGRGQDAAAFLTALLALAHRPPTVFDADALMILARQPELLRHLRAQDVITPHAGETAALLQSSTQEVQKDRFAAVEGLSALSDAVAVLKGAGTLVRQAHAPLLICPYDVPQMAMAGSGDVLAGCVGALLAQQEASCRLNTPEPVDGTRAQSPLVQAGMAVVWHVLAGRHCARRYPLRGNSAGELADALPLVRAALVHAQDGEQNLPPLTGVLPWPA